MQSFELAVAPEQFLSKEYYKRVFHVGEEEAQGMVRIVEQEVIVMNDKYQVNISPVFPGQKGWPDFVHLSIKRRDKEPIHDWRDLQEIKNMLVGDENEAIEIYPAESRLVDCANQFHLWVFVDPEVRIPVGWKTRMVGDSNGAVSVGAKQRERAA